MALNLHHKVIAGIAGLSLLITGMFAAPARADDNDAARALAAILGIAIVGAAIAKSKKDKDDHHVAKPHPRVQPYVHPRPLPKRVNRKLLPQRCLRTFHVDRGRLSAFGSRCLDRHYQFAHQLPNRCYREVYTDRGWRGVYPARCLSRQGFQLARH